MTQVGQAAVGVVGIRYSSRMRFGVSDSCLRQSFQGTSKCINRAVGYILE